MFNLTSCEWLSTVYIYTYMYVGHSVWTKCKLYMCMCVGWRQTQTFVTNWQTIYTIDNYVIICSMLYAYTCTCTSHCIMTFVVQWCPYLREAKKRENRMGNTWKFMVNVHARWWIWGTSTPASPSSGSANANLCVALLCLNWLGM